MKKKQKKPPRPKTVSSVDNDEKNKDELLIGLPMSRGPKGAEQVTGQLCKHKRKDQKPIKLNFRRSLDKNSANLLWEFCNNENNVKQLMLDTQIWFRYFAKFLIINRQRKLITLIAKNERSKQGQMNWP